MKALDEIRGRWESATPGPWETRTDDLTHDVDVVHDQEQLSFIASCGSKRGPRAHSDAVAIAHAPTDVARLLNAVQAVLDLHIRAGEHHQFCDHDGGNWPCPTVKTLTSALEAGR